jgi:hypothetical protein
VHPRSNDWLGCSANSVGPFAIDSDAGGKVNTPSSGSSAGHAGLATDCVETAFLPAMTFDQDECFGDGSDDCSSRYSPPRPTGMARAAVCGA